MIKIYPRDKYIVSWKVKGVWEKGRYYKTRVLQNTSGWERLNNKGIIKGAKGFKQHLIDVYGRSHLKNFSIKKIKR
jgi:hypothetical protein